MKQLIFFLFLVFPWNFAHSQTIVSSDKEWSNLLFFYSTMSLGTEYIRFTDDTTINAVQYKRVERSLEEIPLNWSFYGYIREDSIRRIYYRTKATETERLLYDLNLELGDSTVVSGLMNFSQNQFVEMTYYVTDIDSFQIGEVFRKQWTMSLWQVPYWAEVEQWIDSTGSKSGMLHNWDGTVGGDGFSLLCFSENSVLLYQNPSYTSCYVVTGIDEKSASNNGIRIYPNPASTYITIEAPAQSQLSIMNLHGQELISQQITEPKTKIDISTLPSSVCLVKVTGERAVKVGKFVKQ